jgi:hypothetical protein
VIPPAEIRVPLPSKRLDDGGRQQNA